MDRLKYLTLVLLALIVAGCGQTVVETLEVTGGPAYNAPGSGKSIVLLPFADYSDGDLQSAHRRSMVITESMTDKLIGQGFGIPIQEDVFEFLVNEDIIKLASYTPANTTSLDVELANDWSESMKMEIARYKTQVENEAGAKLQQTPGAHGLTPKILAKMGRHFNADYVVRGRILEFKTRDEATWLPWKKGLLPFVIGGSNRILTGFASSDAYDETNEILTGMVYGAIIGNNGSSFFEQKGESINTVFGAGLGGVAGQVSARSGKVDQATVQLRVWVQETATGNVVWTNRVRVLVAPESIFADKQYDTLFTKAIDQGVDTLVNDLVSYDL